MLGFSPLADSALADDAPVAGGAPAVDTNRDNFAFLLSGPVGALVVGAVRDAAVQQQDQVSLTPSAILAGAPVLGTPAAATTTLVQPSSIVTGAPVVATVALSSTHDVAGDDIVTGAPVVASVDMSSQQDLSAVGIVTAAPVLGTPLAEDIPPFVVNGIVTGAPTLAGLLSSSLSGSTVVGVLSVPGDYYPIYGIAFSKDGDKLYLSSSNPMGVFQYSLSDPFEAESASYDSFLSTSGVAYRAPLFNGDGTAFYISDNVSRVYKYTLSTPFDLGTASYNSLAFTFTEAADPWVVDTSFNDDGTKFYVLSARFEQRIHQYSLSTPYDLTSHSYDNVSLNLSDSFISVKAFCFANFGRTLYSYSFNQKKFSEYALISPYDISSAVSTNIGYFISGAFTEAATINSRGTSGGDRLYLTDFGSGNNYVRQYDLGLTEASVTIEQFERPIAVGIVTGQPVLEQGDLDQQHTFAPLAVLTGTPVIAATLVTQNIDIAANDIVSGNPVVGETSVATNSEISLNAITTPPVLVGTVTLEEVAVVALSGNNVVSGNPVVGETSVATDSELSLNAVTTVPAVVGQIVVSEENNIILDTVVAGTPSLGSQSVAQQHPLLSSPVVSNVPEVSASELKEKYNLLAQGVTTGDPTVGQVTVTQDHTIVSAPVQTGPVIVNNITIFGAEDTVLSVILVGTPVVTSPDITQTHNISTQGVVSTAPQVGPVAVEQTSSFQNFIAVPVLTQEPVVEDVDSVVTYSFDTVSITFSPPLVGISFLNGATRRVVDVSADTRNFANTNTTRNGAVLNVVYS
jgi:hypothetical protein